MADAADSARNDTWAPLAERFTSGHHSSIHGQARAHVIHHHLLAHLPASPARIVDVGGGGGNQSIPLARLGHSVTIIDPSAEMLAMARARVADEPDDVASRMDLVECDAAHAPSVLGTSSFDVVLSHGVILYVEEPRPFVEALSALAAPGALVSIVAKNARCLAVRPALEGRWADALAAFDALREVNGFGLDTRADTVEGLSNDMRVCGIDPLAWYGVRVFTDGWSWETLRGPKEAVFAVELEASKRDPYRQVSRLFHLLGRKRSA